MLETGASVCLSVSLCIIPSMVISLLLRTSGIEIAVMNAVCLFLSNSLLIMWSLIYWQGKLTRWL